MLQKALKALLLVLVTTICIPALAASPSSILVNMTPTSPSPNETVSITLSSFVNNLNSVNIEWLVDGKMVLSGVGKTSFSTTIGEEGSRTLIEARVLLPEGTISRQILIKPQTLTLLWQANDSYVPPFYKGKAIPTEESQIKIVAIPGAKNSDGTKNSKNMIFEWKQDYENIPTQSGYGKNYFIYSSDYLDSTSEVSVSAYTSRQEYTSEKSIAVTTGQPKIVFYAQDENLGTLWQRSLGDNYRLSGSEIIVAEPYFIAPKIIQIPTLKWVWAINGIPTNTTSVIKNILPIRAPEESNGRAKIRLNISNEYKIFQQATKEINVEF